MNAEQHEWYWKGYNDAKKYESFPTQRQWVELTPEEVVEVANAELSPKSFARGAAWANAKLKEKNT